MANKIKLTIQVDDDGSLAIVGKKAKEAASATDQLDKSTKNLNKSQNKNYRNMQGAAHTSSGLSKNFAKQAQGIQGGLVPAYAALAANIFAVTALFGALQRAAQVQQLTAGITALGQASGIAMNSLARDLQRVTGNALALEDAMRATALTISSGFDSSTLAELGDVARNASIALGRDTADSLNRLVKGATKLEPELLDELGIMVRLDEAAEDYALSIGKTANELSLAEKRQAFMNAVLEEGERKFAAIGAAVDTNPYDKLAASFSDLSKTFFTGINTVLIPVVSVLAESTAALIGVLVLFGSTVLRTMAPSITDIATRYGDLATRQNALTASSLATLGALDGLAPGFRNAVSALAEGKDPIKNFQAAISSTNRSVGNYTSRLENLGDRTLENAEKHDNLTRNLTNAKKARDEATLGLGRYKSSLALSDEAQAASLITLGNYKEGFAKLPGLLEDVDNRTAETAASMSGSFLPATVKLNGAIEKLMIRVRLFGTALLRVLPMVGLIVAGLGALAFAAKFIYDTVLSMFGLAEASEKVAAQTNKLNEVTKESVDIYKELELAQKGQSDSIKTATDEAIAMGNATANQTKEISKMLELLKDDMGIVERFFAEREIRKSVNSMINNNKELKIFAEESRTAVAAAIQNATANKSWSSGLDILATRFEIVIEKFAENKKAAQELAVAIKNSQKPLSEFYNALKVTTPYDNAVASLTEVTEALAKVGAQSEDKAAIEKRLRLLAEGAVGGLGDTFTKEVRSQLKEIRDTEQGIDLNLSTEAQKNLVQELEEELNARLKIFQNMQQQAREGKNVIAIAKNEVAIAKQQQLTNRDAFDLIRATNKEKEGELKVNKANQQAMEQLLLRNKDNKTAAMELKRLKSDEQRIRESILTIEDLQVMKAQNQVSLVNEQQKGLKAILQLQTRINEGSKTGIDLFEQRLREQAKQESFEEGLGRTVQPDQEAKIVETVGNKRIALEEKAREIRDKQITLEFKLIEAQFRLIRAQTAQINAEEGKKFRFDVDEQGRAYNHRVEDFIPLDDIDAALGMISEAQSSALTANVNKSALIIEGIQNRITDTADKSEEYLASKTENNALRRLKMEQEGQRELNDIVSKQQQDQEKILDARREVLEREARAASLANPALRQSVVTAEQQANIEKTLQEERIAAINSERDIKIAMINMEYDLLNAKLVAAKAEAVEAARRDPNVDEEAVARRFDNSIKAVTGARERATTALKDEASNRVADVVEGVGDAARAALDKATGATRGTDGNITGPFAGVMGQADAVEGMLTKGSDTYTENLSERVAGFSKLGMEIQTVFNGIGPESPAMMAAMEGANTIANAWTGAFESINKEGASTSDKIQAGLGAVGATIGAMAQMYKASSDQRIAGIDKEIEAEKKRDGKSKDSLNKIAALERRKESEKRKAFETNKKMQMAQTVIATATGAMRAFELGPIIGPILAGVIIAMGAKQLALIQSQTYNGGGSAGSSGPSKISMGERRSSVDLAKSRGARGELAYMRGERGTGGPENFKPAFAGARYRAAGGETTGYMVGEQGPELFVPERPGRIIANDDVPTGAPINATFNINTIDASGVEEILVSQRGNIIGMIREGANSYGKGFLEDIDTSIYTPSAGGASKY